MELRLPTHEDPMICSTKSHYVQTATGSQKISVSNGLLQVAKGNIHLSFKVIVRPNAATWLLANISVFLGQWLSSFLLGLIYQLLFVYLGYPPRRL